MGEVINLNDYKNKNWEVYEFYWGVGIKNSETNQWVEIILKPNGLSINLEEHPAIVHDNGIEFLKKE